VRQHRRTALYLLILFALSGCGGRNRYGDDPIDDEALQWAHRTGRTPQQAAEGYLPQRIDNYFNGMDGIVTPNPDFAYQLLDKTADHVPPSLTVKDPVDNDWEVLGRNTWMMWAGGNDGFWDWLSTTYGFIDLLKLVEIPREQRFAVGGLINEPGMERRSADRFGLNLDVPTDPEIAAWREQYIKKMFHLDKTCSAVPDWASYGEGSSGGGSYQRSNTTYAAPAPGYGPAGSHNTGYGAWPSPSTKIPPPEIYGLSSGVVGLRLFPNPKFDEDACKRWSVAKYRDDPNGNGDLVRPYRVGMACAFCHASWHPLNPPTQMENPEWANISGNIGAQYLRPRVAFGNQLQKDNFIYHLLDSQPPGTIDTSLIASDNINNPNTMNAVFNLPQRAAIGLRNVRERQGAGSAKWPSLYSSPLLTRPDKEPFERNPRSDPNYQPPYTDAVPESVAAFFTGFDSGQHTHLVDEIKKGVPGEVDRRTSRILLDGADSIGAWGALARVYLNIGTNWEQWNTLHAPVVGFRRQKPFTIANTERHSVYWLATQLRVPALREYFLRVSPPMPLLATAHGSDRADPKQLAAAKPADRHRYVDVGQLAHGRKVFANNCIVCHSSLQPTAEDLAKAAGVADPATVQGRQEELDRAPAGQFWDRDPGKWLTNPGYIKWAEAAVEQPRFWRDNYLSTDYRIAINLVQTNACRAMATNAMNDHMWEDFASDSYRSMPSVGGIPFFNPYKGEQGADDEFYPRHSVENAPAAGGGPGFYRVPTLVSIWATAPFLHNNSLGLFNNDPSVDGRLKSFDDSIRKLLTPAKRLESSSYNDATAERLKADHGLIWRTTQDTYIVMPGSYLPRAAGSWIPAIGWIGYRLGWITELAPWARPLPSLVLLLAAIVLFMRTNRLDVRRVLAYGLLVLAVLAGTVVYFFNGGFGGIRMGPIPKGVPVNLIANANPEAGTLPLLKLAFSARDALTEIASQRPDQKQLDALLRKQVAPELLKVSKCPDLVMDHGHNYDWFKRMSDADKDALIELLKTF
jgi:cytochrome c5